MGLKKVRSINKLNKPVKKIPMIKANQKGIPLSTAKALMRPAPTTAKAGWAKLNTSIALYIRTNPIATKEYTAPKASPSAVA
tara:strand:- start:206 stop:451 length:246 start_codon:yes stop_codon:yes gene_type:complete